MSEIMHEYEIHHPYIIPELEVRENARWLALLIDTEGAMGWVITERKYDRLDERFRYMYTYAYPYISVSMKESESRRTIDVGAELMGVTSKTVRKEPTTTRDTLATGGRVLAIIKLIKPYFDKFGRMAELLTTLFKHRPYLSEAKFSQVLIALLGTRLRPSETQDMMSLMSEMEFRRLIERANQYADLHLR